MTRWPIPGDAESMAFLSHRMCDEQHARDDDSRGTVELGAYEHRSARDGCFIHAVGHDLTYWDCQIEALRGRYNVVAFDLPGHGRSPGAPEDWSFDYGAALVAELIEEVSAQAVHLVGISFGGMLAQVATRARPTLFSALPLSAQLPISPRRYEMV
jgi:hypothetical protein